jgi:hypothetical protein
VAEAIRGIIEKLREKIVEKGVGGGIAGLSLVLNDVVYENVAFIHKYLGNLRQAKDCVIPLGYGAVGLGFNLMGADESLTVGIASGLKGVFDALVFKKPFAFAKDPSTIQVYNLDPNDTIQVIVDGSAVTFATAPMTDSNGNATITLPTAMSSGKHEIIVKTSKKAFYGAVAV